MMNVIDPNLLRSTSEDGTAATPASAIETVITQINLGVAMGGVHFNDAGVVATDITALNTWVKAANASEGHSMTRFSHPTNNRLQYDGETIARCVVTATLSFTCAASNQVLEFAIFVNGDENVSSLMRTKIQTGTDVRSLTVISHPTLTTGDYVEVWCRNTTSDADITIEHGHVHAIAFTP